MNQKKEQTKERMNKRKKRKKNENKKKKKEKKKKLEFSGLSQSLSLVCWLVLESFGHSSPGQAERPAKNQPCFFRLDVVPTVPIHEETSENKQSLALILLIGIYQCVH